MAVAAHTIRIVITSNPRMPRPSALPARSIFRRIPDDRSACRSGPALLRNIEDDAVRVLELAFEVFLLGVLAEVEEELAAGRLNPPLRLLQVVHLETEMMGANERAGIVEPRAL